MKYRGHVWVNILSGGFFKPMFSALSLSLLNMKFYVFFLSPEFQTVMRKCSLLDKSMNRVAPWKWPWPPGWQRWTPKESHSGVRRAAKKENNNLFAAASCCCCCCFGVVGVELSEAKKQLTQSLTKLMEDWDEGGVRRWCMPWLVAGRVATPRTLCGTTRNVYLQQGWLLAACTACSLLAWTSSME